MDTIKLQQRVAVSVEFTPMERLVMVRALRVFSSMHNANEANEKLPGKRYRLDRITSLWVAISTDEEGEGMIGAPIGEGGTTAPLIAADEQRLTIVRPMAQAMASRFNCKVQMAQFTERRDLELYEP